MSDVSCGCEDCADVKCEICGSDPKFTIQIVDDDGKFFIPNQFASRCEVRELILCPACIREIEDAFRGTINMLKRKSFETDPSDLVS